MGTRVVVVEDEPGVRDLLGDILEMEGCDPLCLEHPSLVRNIPQDPPPDLFLIDLMLPEMSGIELAAELRKRGYGRTPMVAMSASSRLLDAARAADLFQDTLAKPFDVREMVGTIHRYLR